MSSFTDKINGIDRGFKNFATQMSYNIQGVNKDDNAPQHTPEKQPKLNCIFTAAAALGHSGYTGASPLSN
jgi:hypothetical protein